jgi:hypothetical protein
MLRDDDTPPTGVPLFLLAVLIPAAYLLAGYFVFPAADATKGTVLAVTGAVLAALAGVVQGWDIDINPGPKLGADWPTLDVKTFLTQAGVLHLIAMPVIVGGTVYLLTHHAPPDAPEFWKFAPVVLWGLFLAGHCLTLPIRRGGPFIGEPLSAGAGVEDNT